MNNGGRQLGGRSTLEERIDVGGPIAWESGSGLQPGEALPGNVAMLARPWLLCTVALVPGGLADAARCMWAPLPVFWFQLLPNIYYLGIVAVAIMLGPKWGLGAGILAALGHAAIMGLGCGQPIGDQGESAVFVLVGLLAGVATDHRIAKFVHAGTELIHPRGATFVPHRLELEPSADRFTTLGQLAPALMHEFRTPLASIEGAGSVLEDTTLTEEKRQEFVAIILKECQRLDLLVGLLDFAHPRSPQYRNEDVVSLIDEVVRRSVNEADEPPHPLRKDVAPGLPQLFCDRELIQQAVLNLLAHTRQVTPPGNEIVLGARSANDHVLIEVTNRPMPAGGKYPDPVYQAASLEYDDEPDLLIVRQIVKRHAGAVRVKRTPDLGVTISMILPFTPRTAT